MLIGNLILAEIKGIERNIMNITVQSKLSQMTSILIVFVINFIYLFSYVYFFFMTEKI